MHLLLWFVQAEGPVLIHLLIYPFITAQVGGRAKIVGAAMVPKRHAGVAISSDGITWTRGRGAVEGTRCASDVGACLEANDGDWWTLDTRSVAVSDVQLFSSGSVNGGTGVYWMFYTGVDFQPVHVPEGMPGMEGGRELEGLCARPGLAMSQV
jgi:hypothetical protein